MSEEMNLEVKELLEALENDEDFKALMQKYNTPNPFTIMGDKRREEWHSSFVSWLLDPTENHKLGKFALEKFLELVESKRENLKIERKDIADMRFETEYKVPGGRIDIFGKNDSVVLVIENKIKADETRNDGKPQSDTYYEYCEEKYKDRQKCYVLLKASSKTRVENKEFISITYQELFDEVIKPAYEYCKKLKLEDTEKVLEQYALDISNPFMETRLANTEKEVSSKIYEKHKKIIEMIRNDIRENSIDNGSGISDFFNKKGKYINNVILESLGKSIIKPDFEKIKLKGRKLLEALLYYNYIIPNKTELIYKYKPKHKHDSATCIVKLDENCKFRAGYYMGDYDGSQEVDPLPEEFDSLWKAEVAVERALKSKSENGGKSAYKLTLLYAGIPEAEGKIIDEILPLL